MDGRDGQPIPNSSAYFMQQRGLGGSGFQNVYYGSPPGMRSMPSASQSLPVQPPPAGLGGGGSGSGGGGSGFHQQHQGQGESPPALSPPRAMGGQVGGEQGDQVVKKKRGRPRKYGPEGKMALVLSPGASNPAMGSAMGAESGSGSAEPGQKRGRGRPPGSGKKQQLACYGEWISSSAGGAFTPHLLMICSGEDIGAKILAFSQKAPRAVCVLSATGSVSTVTLRQPSGGTVTYEGLFEILCLSGSYVLADTGGAQSRSGGLSISLASPDGRVIGGGVGGQLVASSPVQVILGSFIFAGSKSKSKPKPGPDVDSENDLQTQDQIETPQSTPTNQNLGPILSGWSGSRQLDMRNSHMDIDLTRG